MTNSDFVDLVKTGAELLKSPAVTQAMDLLYKLAGPASEQIGLLMGDKVWEYRAKNLIAIVERTRKRLKDAGLPASAVPPRLLIPIVEDCSLENDQTLQEMWAGLLATASAETDAMSPAYIETLKQLTPKEAQFLENIYVTKMKDAHKRPFSPYDFKDPIEKRFRDSFERLGLIRREYGLTRGENSSQKEIGFMVYLTEYGRDFLDACHGPVSKPRSANLI